MEHDYIGIQVSVNGNYHTGKEPTYNYRNHITDETMYFVSESDVLQKLVTDHKNDFSISLPRDLNQKLIKLLWPDAVKGE